jgi:hypothetical protein
MNTKLGFVQKIKYLELLTPVMGNYRFSVANPACLFWIPGPYFYYSGSRIENITKEGGGGLSYLSLATNTYHKVEKYYFFKKRVMKKTLRQFTKNLSTVPFSEQIVTKL